MTAWIATILKSEVHVEIESRGKRHMFPLMQIMFLVHIIMVLIDDKIRRFSKCAICWHEEIMT
jgi:hypothetical protein